MTNIHMGSSQDLDDTVAHYRNKIYTIIHTEKAVRSLYEESFRSKLQEARFRSQKKETRPRFAWQSQTTIQPQMSFMAPMYKPLQLPRPTNPNTTVSLSKMPARDHSSAFIPVKTG